MTDYGHDLLFGAFLTPTNAPPMQAPALAVEAERAGLDLVTFQDHPYQPGLHDTWTLLSYVAAVTEQIRLAPNVINLPLRPPVVLARSVASLDLLSGGRVELGLGAGAFWDAITAAGGRRLSGGQAVAALEEAITIIRGIWAADERGGLRQDGELYSVVGAKRGPAPAHDVGIWVGAYKPKMLALTGRLGDGWLPSLSYLPGGVSDLDDLNAQIDEAATSAGRDPGAVRWLLNVSGLVTPTSRGVLVGPAEQWVEELAGLAMDYGISGLIVGTDDPTLLHQVGEQIAPAVRELVAAERADPSPEPAETEPTVAERIEVAGASGFATVATPDPGVRLAKVAAWDESTRPVGPPAPAGFHYTDQAQAVGRHLVDVHDHLRQELAQVRDLIEQVRTGAADAGHARSAINAMTMRQNEWTLGAYCSSYCRVVTQHHSLEDSQVFPHLRRADAELTPVIDRLEEEHVVIHDVLERVDTALVRFVTEPADFTGLQAAVDLLTDTLLSHLAYEEQQIIEPIARYGFYSGQV